MSASNRILFGENLRSSASAWLEELGSSDRDRLRALFDLAVSEKTRLSDALSKLYPGVETIRALADLTRLRKRINDAADGDPSGKPDLGFRFHVDTKKKNPPPERTCWFTGPDAAMARVTEFSKQATQDIEGQPFVASRGIATSSSALAAGKRVVRFFISYAHENKALAEALVKELRSQFSPSKRYELDLWIDREIMVGEGWHAAILRAIHDCDFGLFLVSPDFLGSRYIGENEIPPFVRSGNCKPVIPVGLVPVSFSRHDTKGLEESQIFFTHGRDFGGRTYDQMKTAAAKRDFVHQLYLEAEKRLDAHFGPGGCSVPAPGPVVAKAVASRQPVPAEGPCHLSAVDADTLVPLPEDTPFLVRPKGFAHHLSDRERLDDPKAKTGDARDALDCLEAWATAADSPPFYALLGEVGIGKTTTLKQLTRQLIEKRQTDPKKYPLPIYIDLRDYVGDQPGRVPTIEELLTSVIQRSWRVTEKQVTAADILRLVREEGALILFDGLDEKIVHLKPSQAREFIRTLWSVLPEAMLRNRPAHHGMGKLLLSCRSHYFRDVWSQNAMLTGEDREHIDRSQYPAFCLLPFDEEQIRSYLTSFLGDAARADAALALIASIHNLLDLAERPYLLNLISGRLAELESLQMRGETVNAARLYDLVVRSWLNRDDGKHQLDPTHKRRLMEELAAALWRSGEKLWDVDRLEEWLDDFLLSQPSIRDAYANKDRTLLKEDLRTATFVLRPDGEEKSFRFAHTSLQEYFLACHLARALREKNDVAWDLPIVSLETQDFLGQILAAEPRKAECLASLEQMLGADCLPAACLAFQYWLEAIKHGHPEPQPKHVNLAGAEGDEWEIKGHSALRPLNLRGANLRGIQLNRSRVEFVDATDADLTGMQARQALFMQVSAPRAKVVDADVAGLKWRIGSLDGADVTGSDLSVAELIHVSTAGAIALPPPDPPLLASSRFVKVFTGHAGGVTACAWSPNGKSILSGSDDSTLKVWDATTGKERLTLLGNNEAVSACAWSPDGKSILSGSYEGSLKVWDAFSGEERFSFTGQLRTVTSCDWSPDGKSILTASNDKTLKVWDATTRKERLCMIGHTSEVMDCAWSPDGQSLLSASDDHTLKVWDAATGKERLSLRGHTGWIRSCAWSPDGKSILSGSRDSTLKIWDATTGKERLSLTAHSEGVSVCTWSPDGRSVLSGSLEGELKVWDASSGRECLSFTGDAGWFMACAWSSDGQRILSCSGEGTLKVWDAATGQERLFVTGYNGWVSTCAWSPNGLSILSGSEDNTLKVWDAASGKERLSLTGHRGWVMACAWSPNGQSLLSASHDHTLKVWDAASGQERLSLRGHTEGVWACAWSPDGQSLLSASDDKTLRIWDATTGIERFSLKGHTGWVRACAWSPDSQSILSGSEDCTLKIWDGTLGKERLSLTGHAEGVRACAWSPDGRSLLSASSDGTVKIWDAFSGMECFSLKSESCWVMACSWSPDGKSILSGTYNNALKVWDAATGGERLSMVGHAEAVWACAWSPDGKSILSGSADQTLKVWDATTGECLWTGYHLPEGHSAAISGDRQQILSATAEAWRWLGWQTFDAAGRFLQRLPIEAFGPIPMDASKGQAPFLAGTGVAK